MEKKKKTSSISLFLKILHQLRVGLKALFPPGARKTLERIEVGQELLSCRCRKVERHNGHIWNIPSKYLEYPREIPRALAAAPNIFCQFQILRNDGTMEEMLQFRIFLHQLGPWLDSTHAETLWFMKQTKLSENSL